MPPPPRRNMNPKIEITSPIEDSIVGSSIHVTGTAGCTLVILSIPPSAEEADGLISKVEVRFGGGAFKEATPMGPFNTPWTSWSFTGSRSTQGTMAITARVTATSSTASPKTAQKKVSREVDVDLTAPVLGITPPEPVIKLPPHTTKIRGNASDVKAGMGRVDWKLGSGAFQPAIKDKPNWSQWHADVT